MCPRKAAGGTSSPQVLSLGDQQQLASTSCSWTGQLADFFTFGLHLLSISSSKSCSPDTKVLSLHCNHQCPKRPYSFGMLLIPRNVSSALTPSLVSANTSFLFPQLPSSFPNANTSQNQPFCLSLQRLHLEDGLSSNNNFKACELLDCAADIPYFHPAKNVI